MTHFAICIATYKRMDGKTPELLKRTLESINKQFHYNWKVFLIGDLYENEDEFLEITKDFPKGKIYQENLKVAVEREKYYPHNLNALWSFGGTNAVNYAIDVAIYQGYQYICRIDHDDYWREDHLANFDKVIKETGAKFICSKAKHFNGAVLPYIPITDAVVDYYPEPSGVVKSSTCVHVDIPIRTRDLYGFHGKDFKGAGDEDFWERVSMYLKGHHLVSKCWNDITCFHDQEGYIKTVNN